MALSLLSRGEASPAELAALAGVSRQVIEGWARRAGMDLARLRRDAEGKRHRRLTEAWRKEMRHGPKVEEMAGHRGARGR